MRTSRVHTVFLLLQRLVQASCYKATQGILLLTDLLTRVLLTIKNGVFGGYQNGYRPTGYQIKMAFSVETCEVATKTGESDTGFSHITNGLFGANLSANHQNANHSKACFRCVPVERVP